MSDGHHKHTRHKMAQQNKGKLTPLNKGDLFLWKFIHITRNYLLIQTNRLLKWYSLFLICDKVSILVKNWFFRIFSILEAFKKSVSRYSRNIYRTFETQNKALSS